MAQTAIKSAKTLIRCIVAPYEADSQLAFLSRNNIVDAVLTEDSDLFIFEANTAGFQIITAYSMLHTRPLIG